MSELWAIQKRLHVAKEKYNKHGGFSYRTAEGILAAVKPILGEGEHITLTDRIEAIGGSIFLIATATLKSDDKEWSSESAAMHPLTQKGMNPSQITGSASSYARKYALCGLLAIDDGSGDPDASEKDFEPEPEPTATDAEIDTVTTAIKDIDKLADLGGYWAKLNKDMLHVAGHPDVIAAKDKRKAELEKA